MTAYGRATTETDLGPIGVEVHSVNRKFLDVQVHGPKFLTCIDMEIRKWVGATLDRGQVTVRIVLKYPGYGAVSVTPNLNYARGWRQACDALAGELELPVKDVALALLANNSAMIAVDDEWDDTDGLRVAVKMAVDAALQPFVAMKIAEGRVLEADLLARVGQLDALIGEVALAAPSVVDKQREKLQKAIGELQLTGGEMEERLMREVALFAERVDIAEEVTRFQSHLAQLRETIVQKEGAVGKTLEFLLQELLREINTIGAKSSDARVVAAKTEIERIREQVQNVE